MPWRQPFRHCSRELPPSGLYLLARAPVPTKVERVALQNAGSISGLLLTTDCAITEIKEKKDKAAGGGGMDDFDD